MKQSLEYYLIVFCFLLQLSYPEVDLRKEDVPLDPYRESKDPNSFDIWDPFEWQRKNQQGVKPGIIHIDRALSSLL